jgi:uncharacterized protein (TIGR03435 family)
MRTASALFSLLFGALGSTVFTQVPAQNPATGPAFEVVSIKRNTTGQLGSNVNPRPDGGFTMTNGVVGTLIARAYSSAVPGDMIGLPGWAMSERYDVSATSSLPKVTPDERTAMMRAMLADRFKLVVHFEQREQPVFDLLLARDDGKLGPGIKRIDADCAAKLAADRAAAEAGTPPARPSLADLNAPPPPCTLRSVGSRPGSGTVGDRLEGETTMDNLAAMLRLATGRFVVNKTGLPGSYSVTMAFDGIFASRRLEVAASPEGPPSVFTAIREQLGLKLESSRAERDTLVIDRLERPSEN